MPRKRIGQSTDKPPEPTNGIIAKVQAIFEEDTSETWNLEAVERFNELYDVTKLVGDKFIDALGNSQDFEVGYFPPEPLDGGFSPKQVIVVGKSDFHPASVSSLIRQAWKALFQVNLDVSEGHFVLNGVIERIENECAFRFRLVNGVIERDNGMWDRMAVKARGGVISGPFQEYPYEVTDSLAKLKGLAKRFIINKTRTAIETFGLADQELEIKRRIDASCWKHTDFKDALELLLADRQKEIRWQKERKEIIESINHDEAEPRTHETPEKTRTGKANRPKHKLTAARAVMLVRHIAPRLTSALNQENAELIAFLTGIAPSTIYGEFSQVIPREEGEIVKGAKEPDNYQKDVEAVCYYLNLVGLSNESAKLKGT
jgi:hypothetical protein